MGSHRIEEGSKQRRERGELEREREGIGEKDREKQRRREVVKKESSTSYDFYGVVIHYTQVI